MNDTEGHSLQQTTLRFHPAQSAALTFAVIETLHRIPGVLTAAKSGTNDGRMTVSHDSAVPADTIYAAAKFVDASAALVGRVCTPAQSNPAPKPAARANALRIGIAFLLLSTVLEVVNRLGGSGFAKQVSVIAFAMLIAAVLARPFFARGRHP